MFNSTVIIHAIHKAALFHIESLNAKCEHK